MLLVIFGAGASYDSVPSRPPDGRFGGMQQRLPLANELFADRQSFASMMNRFPRCRAIVPYLQQAGTGDSVERILERLQNEASEYPERHRQLAAVRYYLHVMLWQCGDGWKAEALGVTNYLTLLDQIQRWRKPQEKVCLVTFNYDTMLEEALPLFGVTIRELRDYIAGDIFNVFKVHGSINWAHEIETRIEGIENLDNWDAANAIIERAADLKIKNAFQLVSTYPIGRLGASGLYPALAIPVETKLAFECPEDHLDTLRNLLPEVGKVLVVGWRGTEAHFLKLLGDNIKQPIRAMVVAGKPEWAEDPIGRLKQAGIKGEFHAASGGFTDFIVKREGDDFLRFLARDAHGG